MNSFQGSAEISGLGVLCSLGDDVETVWSRCLAGESGAISTQAALGPEFPVKCYAPVPENERFGVFGINRALGFIESVVEQAITQAGLSDEMVRDSQFVIAICPFDLPWDRRQNMIGDLDSPSDAFVDIDAVNTDFFDSTAIEKLLVLIMHRFGLRRFPIMLHTACSSGNSAIQFGLESIRAKETETAIVVGCEISTHPEALIRFNLLGTLAAPDAQPADAARPFSKNRRGFVLGEGAAALVLQNPATCKHPLAKVLGAGEAVDTFHRTRSDTEATAAVRSVAAALFDSGLTASDIDSINAHGTGTQENDKTEAKCIEIVFGDRARDIPVTSNKSILGHTLSAAGVVEAVLSVKSLETGIIPPTLNHVEPDPAINLDVVTAPRQCTDMNVIMSNSFGFGGQNVCVVFAGPGA